MQDGVQDTSREHVMREYIGRGIDLFDVDPWSPPTKGRVIIDAAKIDSVVIDATGLSTIYGDSYLDIKHKIALDFGLSGSYEGFSGSIDAKYNYSSETIRKSHFMMISFLITGYRLSISGREGLKNSLAPTFSEALKTASPDQLFDDYGTHIVAAIKTGGKAEYFCRSTDTSTLSSDDFELAAMAKYEALGGSIEGTGKVNVSSASEQKDVVGNENISTLGGDAALAARISPTSGWAEWAKSCQDLPAFLGYDQDSLVPVWELADDPARQNQIRDAYRRRAAKALRTHVMSVTSDSANHPDARITIPDGYKLLSGGALDAPSDPGNMLTGSFPESDSTWRASGKDHLGGSPSTATAYAIVTYDPDNIWDITLRQSTSGRAQHPTQDTQVQDGYTMIGGGAQVQWSAPGSLLTASYPRNGTTWTCAAADHLQPSPATITAYAIGLKCNVGGLRVLQNIQRSSSSPENHPTAGVSPPTGYVLVGGGAVVNYSGAGNLLTASYPRDERTWEARSTDHLQPDPATLDVYAVSLQIVNAPA